MTTASSSCSPLRSSSRVSIGPGRAPSGQRARAGPGVKVPFDLSTRSGSSRPVSCRKTSSRVRRPRSATPGSTPCSRTRRTPWPACWRRRPRDQQAVLGDTVHLGGAPRSAAASRRVGRARLGDHQPDRAAAGAPGELVGVPEAISRPRSMTWTLVGEPLGLVHVVRGQHDRDAVAAQLARAAPRWRAGPAGPCRRSARRRRPAPGGRPPPSPAPAAAAGRRRAGGTASGRTTPRPSRSTSIGTSSGWACRWRRGGASPPRGPRSRRRRTGASRRCGAAARRGRGAGRARAPGPPAWGRR